MRPDPIAVLLSVMLVGCDGDVVAEPSPSPPTASAPAHVAPRPPAPARAGPTGLDRELLAAKESRIEVCLFGTQGIAVLRDAYLASTKLGPPGPGRLPEWGEYPPTDATAKGPVPFLPFMEACHKARAAGVGAPIAGIDPALETYEAYVTELHKNLVNATRYYARKDYDGDSFRAGRAFHAALSPALAKFDAQYAAFATKMAGWQKTRPMEPPPGLDEAGAISHRSIVTTRELTTLLIGGARDAAREKDLLEKVGATADALEHASPDAPHIQVALRLRGYAAAAEALVATSGKPSPSVLYPVVSEQARLFEAHLSATVALARRRQPR